MGMKERAIWLQETALRVGNDIWNETSRANAQWIREVPQAGPAVLSRCLVTRHTDVRLHQQQPPGKPQQAPKSQIKYSRLTGVLLISWRVRSEREWERWIYTHTHTHIHTHTNIWLLLLPSRVTPPIWPPKGQKSTQPSLLQMLKLSLLSNFERPKNSSELFLTPLFQL